MTDSSVPDRVWTCPSMQALANDRQRRFVAEFSVDLNATQAAARAGYNAATAAQQASRLLRNVKVQEALNSTRDLISTRLELSIEGILLQLSESVEEARAAGQFSSAVRGLELIGKHLRMWGTHANIPPSSPIAEANSTEDSRTDAERIQEFTDDVAVMANQLQKMDASVAEFLRALEELTGNEA